MNMKSIEQYFEKNFELVASFSIDEARKNIFVHPTRPRNKNFWIIYDNKEFIIRMSALHSFFFTGSVMECNECKKKAVIVTLSKSLQMEEIVCKDRRNIHYLTEDKDILTVDHIIPYSANYTTEHYKKYKSMHTNLQMLCSTCKFVCILLYFL